MVETQEENTVATSEGLSAPTLRPQPKAALLCFIHDGWEAFRLELIGDLAQVDVAELQGTWKTARSSVASKKFVIDLRRLKSIDQAGEQWIAAMVRERAELLGQVPTIPMEPAKQHQRPSRLRFWRRDRRKEDAVSMLGYGS